MNKIILLILLLITIPYALADVETNTTVATSGNMDSYIYLYANENISNNLYCNGNNCINNVMGNVNVDNDSDITVNDYSTHQYEENGLDLGDLVYYLGRSLGFYTTQNERANLNKYAWGFWEMLDSFFVNHFEFESTRYNTLYLAEEVDRLNAENKMLKKYLEIEYDPLALECQTGIEKALRTGQRVETVSGFIIDIPVFGEECISVS